uniref:Uncharacterized protein n=1 Tax=Arion vulgaris TaxID=1028688 RepID=A0A0B7A8L0_9EUPU
MSDFRGRGRGIRGSRGRASLLRGSPRSGSRGGYEREGGFSRGRGDGFSRGRGGPPPRHLSRDDSPPRKVPMLARGYESGRGPPLARRLDRYEEGYDRGVPSRSRDVYSSPPRETGRLLDRLTPPRGSLRVREHGISSRATNEYPTSRGDFLPTRSYSPPTRESGSYRETYSSSLRDLREDRREVFSRPGLREYAPQRSAVEYAGERSRDFRESPRDYGSARDYPPTRGEFREPLSGRGEFREREYTSGRLFPREEVRVSSRGPPSREYVGRGGPRGSLRASRDGRGGFLNGKF